MKAVKRIAVTVKQWPTRRCYLAESLRLRHTVTIKALGFSNQHTAVSLSLKMSLEYVGTLSLRQATLLAPSSTSFPFSSLISFLSRCSLWCFCFLYVIRHASTACRALYVMSRHSPIHLVLFRNYIKVEMHSLIQVLIFG